MFEVEHKAGTRPSHRPDRAGLMRRSVSADPLKIGTDADGITLRAVQALRGASASGARPVGGGQLSRQNADLEATGSTRRTGGRDQTLQATIAALRAIVDLTKQPR
jgi:hypothetical protein